MVGFPSIITDENSDKITGSYVIVSGVVADSPAKIAGIEPGDEILQVIKGETVLPADEITISNIQNVISAEGQGEVSMTLKRKGEEKVVTLNTTDGILSDKPAIGISMERIGILRFSFFRAIYEGFLLTLQTLKDVAVGLVSMLGSAIVGHGSLNDVAGPVGIIGLVHSSINFGFYYLLSFTAYISLNLAVINILPLPALDGGRLLVILIEAIRRKPIKSKALNWINGIGFAVLILFMIIVTVNDIFRMF